MSSSVAQLLLAEDDQPTDDEVKAYAAFLGVDLDRFPELRGLVLDGLTAPLPPGWTVTVVESGEGQGTFYQHTTSGMWLDEHPYDKVFRRRAQLRMQELCSANGANGADGAVPPALGVAPVFGSCRQVTVTADVEPLSDDDEWGGFAGTGVPRSAPLAPSHIARLEREFVYDVLQQQPGQSDVDRDTAAPPHATETVAPAPPPPMATPSALPSIPLVDSAMSSDASPTQDDGSAQPPPPSARSLRRVTNNAPTTAIADSQPSAAAASPTGAVPPPPTASLRPKTKLPAEFVCPITADIMRDPVVIADGFSYEREAIQRWFAKHDTSPITGAVLINRAVFPNTTLRVHIGEFMQSYEIDEEA